MGPVRMYFRLVGLSVRSQLRYRSALALQVAGQFLITAIEFGGLYALFERFGHFRGWELPELAFLYGFVDMAFSLADALAYGFDFMGTLVRTGDFDRLLTRPLSPVLQLLGREVTIRRAGRLAQGLAVFVWAAVSLASSGTTWYRPLGLAALAAGFLAGVVVFLSVFLMQAALTFRTVEGLEFMNAFIYGGRQASAYPASGHRPWMRVLFLGGVPLASVMYLPVCLALGREAFTGWPLWLGLAGPFAAVPFAGLAWLLWKAGLRRYQSGGG